MPTNKDAEVRYRIIDRCLSDRLRKYTIYDLVDEVNRQLLDLLGKTVSKRTIQKDLEELTYRPYCAPIESYKGPNRKHYIHYSDDSYSIYSNDLSVKEVQTLQSVINMLGRFRGSTTHAWLEEVISNLEYRFGIKNNAERLVAFEENEQLQGLEHLSPLIDATLHCQVIELAYEPYGKTKRICPIHPYFMKQYNGRWFLFGLNTEKGKIETYALDRIKAVKTLAIEFIPNEDTDFEAYFEHIVGVSVPYGSHKPIELILRFSEKRFPYVRSKPIHVSQKLLSTPCTISISVIPTPELTQQIFSFGPDVEVLAPESFRHEIAEKIKATYNLYQTV